MVGADHQPNQVRHDDADERDRPAERHGGPVASEALTSAMRSARCDVDAAAAADSRPTLMRSSTRGSVANTGVRQRHRHERGEIGG